MEKKTNAGQGGSGYHKYKKGTKLRKSKIHRASQKL